MSDHLNPEERAAEIAGRIVMQSVSPGGNSGHSGTYTPEQGKTYGAGARAMYEEVFKGVLSCLQPDHELLHKKV